MSNSKQTPFQRCLALICLGVLLTVAGCTAPSATTSPTTEADATTTTTAAESAPQAGSETAPETAAKEPPARRFIPAPKAPRMSDPMPPERMPSPVALDYSCRADADCAVKNVGNCCGMMPACVNKDSPTDPAAVQAECASKGLSSVCGFREISACSCVDNRCQAQSSSAPVAR